MISAKVVDHPSEGEGLSYSLNHATSFLLQSICLACLQLLRLRYYHYFNNVMYKSLKFSKIFFESYKKKKNHTNLLKALHQTLNVLALVRGGYSPCHRIQCHWAARCFTKKLTRQKLKKKNVK